MSAPKGRFVWYDLMTSDVEAARAFYTETLGWKTRPWQGPTPYTMWTAHDRPVGGVMAMPAEMKAAGAPPHWLGYVLTDDAEGTSKSAVDLGGKILQPTTPIPGIGRFAILADSVGAGFAIVEPKNGTEAPERNKPGEFSWAELNTTDRDAAWAFYRQLFGWEKTGSWDIGQGAGEYLMFKDPASDGSRGGISNMARVLGVPPHWVHYVTVDDMDATVKRVESNGGKVINGPMEIPEGSRIAHCDDPQGAPFALYWEQ